MCKIAVKNKIVLAANQIGTVRGNTGIYKENPINGSKSCEYSYFMNKMQRIGFLAYLLERLRVPQVGRHCTNYSHTSRIKL